MLLSIIIPAYNEIKTVADIIQKVRNLDLDKEIIIVDDGSSDGTRELLTDLQESSEFDHSGHDTGSPNTRIKVIFHQQNMGKGAALNTGFKAASGDVLVVQDADLEYDPRDFYRMLPLIEEGYADIVYGSRFSGGLPHRAMFFWHSYGNRFLTFLSNIFSNLHLTDMETCYKMFRKEIIDQIEIREKGFGIEAEITAKLAKMKKIRVCELGISYYGRSFSEGKKIGWRDAVRTIYCIVKYNLFSR